MKSIDPDAGHHADDSLSCAKDKVGEGATRVLRSQAQQYDVGPVDNGLIEVGDLDGWVASGELIRPRGISRGEVDGALDVLSLAEACDDRLGDCPDTDDAKVTGHVASSRDLHRAHG
jgi:hypothetical protein